MLLFAAVLVMLSALSFALVVNAKARALAAIYEDDVALAGTGPRLNRHLTIRYVPARRKRFAHRIELTPSCVRATRSLS